MARSEIVPLILCGGWGSRLWPLAREGRPKQFVDLGGGRTLFGDALERGRLVAPCSRPIVLSNWTYRFFLREELHRRELKARIICEPMPKNTAPAIALAALSMLEGEGAGEELMLVLPSDQAIGNMELFKENVEKAKRAAREGYIVTFGIFPDYPETGFGYMASGEDLGDGTFRVGSFVEKPALEDARKMINAGGHYWNAGIFLMRPAVFLRELEKHRPDIYGLCLEAWQRRGLFEGLEMPDRELFSRCAACSIDYAVMEKSSCAAVRPLDLPWNDLGSWNAFFREREKDGRGNAAAGNVVFEDCSSCQAYGGGMLVAALGVEDLNIIATEDAVLVSKDGSGEKIKKLLLTLKEKGFRHYDQHPRHCMSWGAYENLAGGEGFLVRRLTIKAGENAVLQKNGSDTRHLVIISGTAEFVMDGESASRMENQCIRIPPGRECTLGNPGRQPLELIEVQAAACLDEEARE